MEKEKQRNKKENLLNHIVSFGHSILLLISFNLRIWFSLKLFLYYFIHILIVLLFLL